MSSDVRFLEQTPEGRFCVSLRACGCPPNTAEVVFRAIRRHLIKRSLQGKTSVSHASDDASDQLFIHQTASTPAGALRAAIYHDHQVHQRVLPGITSSTPCRSASASPGGSVSLTSLPSLQVRSDSCTNMLF